VIDVACFTLDSVADYSKVFFHLWKKRPEKDPNVVYMRAKRKVKVECLDDEVPFQGDGDYVAQTPIEIEVVPSAIQFAVPMEKDLAEFKEQRVEPKRLKYREEREVESSESSN